jgi:predicted DCC family thiol-disulfide oxidoreductase YuxK
MTPPVPPSEELRRPMRPVLLFDGECGLCHRIVRLLLWLDRVGRLHYAPLQGPSAQAYLRAHGLPPGDFDSVIFVRDWNELEQTCFCVRTAAVIAALRATRGGIARMLAAALTLLPVGVRDAGYRLVARWRYRVFGPWQERPLVRREWSERFLA